MTTSTTTMVAIASKSNVKKQNESTDPYGDDDIGRKHKTNESSEEERKK